MAFSTMWHAIGADVGGIRIFGDTNNYRIRWGDGQEETVSKNVDWDNDGTFDAAEAVHFYQQDGTYDIEVRQLGAGIPPVRMRAFMYSSATNDLNIGGTWLSDIMTGGTGRDDFRGAAGDDTLGGGGGDDRLSGGDGNDFLIGGDGDDLLIGGAGSDLLGGNEGNDILQGGADRDFLYGDRGNDKLFGGDGDDYLQGGAGVDRLDGGAGADTFSFARPRDASDMPLATDPDRDTIVQFQQGSDRIEVNDWFAGGFTFLGADKFTGAGNEVRFNNVNGVTVVLGDVDGDKIPEFSFRIENQLVLTAEDFGIFAM